MASFKNAKFFAVSKYDAPAGVDDDFDFDPDFENPLGPTDDDEYDTKGRKHRPKYNEAGEHYTM